MNSYYQNRRPEVAELLPKDMSGKRVLEVGCGAGLFRSNIDQPCEYWGIEPFPEVAQQAAGRLDKVLVGTFQNVCDQVPDGYFDCVVCNDVIEHMVSEDQFFSTIKLKMKPDGFIVGSVPNVRFISHLVAYLVRKDWQYVSEGILDRTHLRFFTQKSLRRSIEVNGYHLLDLKGINPSRIRGPGLGAFVKSAALIFLTFLFGSDTRFAQFAFRARPGGLD